MRATLRLLCVTILLIAVSIVPVLAQDDVSVDFESVDALIEAFEATVDDSAALDALWDALVDADAIPFTSGEDVLFLYRGEAETVAWNGDFNGWGQGEALEGDVIAGDVWGAAAQFPSDARLDYKIVVDGEWILDPANDRQQWSGFGPNSELAMPDYEPEPLVERQGGIERGTLSDDVTLYSENLEDTINYRLYKPTGYDQSASYPVIYVTDGHEYFATPYGAMKTVLDNMIAAGTIEPVMAVFIDPRTTDDIAANRREELYIDNDAFNAFIVEELVPLIDRLYATDATSEARAILGTSFGGYHSTLMSLEYPEVFDLIGIQSPAYWRSDGVINKGEELLAMADDMDEETLVEIADQKYFIASGNPMWDADITESILYFEFIEAEYMAMTVNEGHSWGQWRAQIDDLLLYFFGTK